MKTGMPSNIADILVAKASSVVTPLKLFVKLAIGFFGFGEIAEFFYRLFHNENIGLAANLSERI
jgi:hypothetical protein